MPGWSALLAHLTQLQQTRTRPLLGIAGAPGAGKSTLAARLASAVPGAVVVPMDGFHLDTATLAARGWVDERGTPRTFDAEGYVELLRHLRAGDDVSAPGFDRTGENPLPGAVRVPATAPLVITEGNYLLLPEPPWSSVRGLLDAVWFVEVPEAERVRRLIARHVAFGRSPAEARRRVLTGSDADNAQLVAATRSGADLIVDLGLLADD